MLHRQTANAGLLALPPMTAQIATALGPALDEPVALQQPSTVHVRFGSKADILGYQRDVRFTPKSGHRLSVLRCPLSAKKGGQQSRFTPLHCA